MLDGLCKYYFLLSLIFIFLAVFCSIFVSTYKTDKCLGDPVVVTSNTTTTTNSTMVQEVLSLQLTSMPAILCILYAVEGALLIVVTMLYLWFSTYLPRQFGKLGRIIKCCGIFLRIFPKLVILMHYIILILIIVLIAQVANGACAKSFKIDANGLVTNVPTDMQLQGVVLTLIVTVLWLLCHIGGWIVRSIINIEPFIIEPEDPQANRFIRLLCIRCGP